MTTYPLEEQQNIKIFCFIMRDRTPEEKPVLELNTPSRAVLLELDLADADVN